MFSFIKASALTAVVGLGAIAAGCQSNGAATTRPAHHEMGVECSKCEVTWKTTNTPAYIGGKGTGVTVVRRSEKSMVCDECQNVATNYLPVGRGTVPGKAIHTCKMCGGEMKTCHVG